MYHGLYMEGIIDTFGIDTYEKPHERLMSLCIYPLDINAAFYTQTMTYSMFLPKIEGQN
jgi:hypothetical protein